MLRCNVALHLEVLDSDRQLFDSELKLTQDRANMLLAVIALYRALGGGWQTEDTPGPEDKVMKMRRQL